MSRYQVVDFDWRYAHHLAENLSAKDMEELTLGELSPVQTLIAGQCMGRCYIGLEDGIPICVFGATYTGSIWALFTDLSFSARKEIAKQAPRWVRQLLRETGRFTLRNRTLSTNHTVLKWLAHCECFRMEEPDPDSRWVHFDTIDKGALALV